MNTWVTSDTHFGHKNICRGESNWLKRITNEGGIPSEEDIANFKRQTRPFDSVAEMNQALVDNINANVKEDDTLWHLGDWALGGLPNITLFREQLRCKNIHLIIGNHDHHIAKKPELQALFSSVQTTFGWPQGKKIGGRRFVMCHFPLLVWEKHMHGAIQLHGHSHGSLKDEKFYTRRVMDVGIDCHPEFRPFHLDEIIKKMEDRKIVVVDHHSEDIDA